MRGARRPAAAAPGGGYSGTPLAKKLGIGPGCRLCLRQAPQNYAALVAPLPAGVRADTVLWVSWPKKSSGLASELGEDQVRELALPLGLVDVKVCAVDETWSGLKLVVRKALRANWPRRRAGGRIS